VAFPKSPAPVRASISRSYPIPCHPPTASRVAYRTPKAPTSKSPCAISTMRPLASSIRESPLEDETTSPTT
jgi:hypothetical protein